jgi:hypothetical protein
MASETHFFVKLVLAAPANFLSAAVASQLALASVSHFFMKLVFAAPASFLSLAVDAHDEPSASASDGNATAITRPTVTASKKVLISGGPFLGVKHDVAVHIQHQNCALGKPYDFKARPTSQNS